MVGGGFHSIKHKHSWPQHWESYARVRSSGGSCQLCHAVSSDFAGPVVTRQDFVMMLGDHERLKSQALRFADIEALLYILYSLISLYVNVGFWGCVRNVEVLMTAGC